MPGDTIAAWTSYYSGTTYWTKFPLAWSAPITPITVTASCTSPVCPIHLCKVPGWATEGLLLLADPVFGNWNFRKIYFESATFNYDRFASGAGVYFQEEARLKDHTFYGGHYWDLVIGSLTRAGLERIRGVREMRHHSIAGDDALPGIEQFCITVADTLGLDRDIVQPESRWWSTSASTRSARCFYSVERRFGW